MSVNKNIKNTKGKQVLNEKYCTEKYSSYNQIIKEFDVFILSNEEYDKLSEEDKKEAKHMVLKKKTNINPPDPTKPPIWFSWWVENEFRPIILGLNQKIDDCNQKIDDVKQKQEEDHKLLIKVIELNNLKTK